MLFGICPHMSCMPIFWHKYVITYSDFMVIVEPCYCMQSSALFENIFKFCTFLPKFSNILPLFSIYLPFFSKIAPMPFLSRIGPEKILREELKLKIFPHLLLKENFCKASFLRTKHVNSLNLTLCFLGTFIWVPILVNQYEIHSGYSTACILTPLELLE